MVNQMVSQLRAEPPSSRDRLLAAAVAEFAARGFDGAKVDRIAARARLNKAMLYYHFRSKADLYRAILTELFQSMTRAVSAARDERLAPEDQIRTFIRALAAQMAARPSYPAIWVREMAEGGRHVDASIVHELRRVIEVLAGILQDGRRRGVFGDAHPIVTQMAIVGALLLFNASAPARERFRAIVPDFAAATVPADAILHYVEKATLAALAPPAAVALPRKRRPRR